MFALLGPKNWRPRTEKRWLCFDLCIQEVDQAYELVQQFQRCFALAPENNSIHGLRMCGPVRSRELQGFVAGVERDKKAVKAGLTLPTSNGMVEGNVNKLKLVKRMGYGRAGFPLLRQRVLHAL